jgi:hypothetical protein
VNKKKNSPIYFQSSLLKSIRNLCLSSLSNMLQSHPIRLTIRVLDRCDDWGCEAPFIPHFLRTDTPVTCAIKNRIVEEMELKKRQCIDQATYGVITNTSVHPPSLPPHRYRNSVSFLYPDRS